MGFVVHVLCISKDCSRGCGVAQGRADAGRARDWTLGRLGHVALGWGLSPAFGAGFDPAELDFVILCP